MAISTSADLTLSYVRRGGQLHSVNNTEGDLRASEASKVASMEGTKSKVHIKLRWLPNNAI